MSALVRGLARRARFAAGASATGGHPLYDAGGALRAAVHGATRYADSLPSWRRVRVMDAVVALLARLDCEEIATAVEEAGRASQRAAKQ